MLLVHRAGIAKTLARWRSKFTRRARLLAPIRNPRDGMLFARLLLFAAAVPWLAKLGLPRLETWLVPRRALSAPAPADVQKIIDYTDAALQFGRPLVRAKCLTRGVTLYYFLSRTGVDLTLVFGATSVDGQFSAHCWLVRDGMPFAEEPDPGDQYAVLYTIPTNIPSSQRPAHRRG